MTSAGAVAHEHPEIAAAYAEAAKLAREGWTEVRRLQAEVERLTAVLAERPTIQT